MSPCCLDVDCSTQIYLLAETLHRFVHAGQEWLNSSFSFTFSGKATVELLLFLTIAWLFWGGSKAYSSLSLLWNLWFHNLATSNRNRHGPALLPPAKWAASAWMGWGWAETIRCCGKKQCPLCSPSFHSSISQSHTHFYVVQDLISPLNEIFYFLWVNNSENRFLRARNNRLTIPNISTVLSYLLSSCVSVWILAFLVSVTKLELNSTCSFQHVTVLKCPISFLSLFLI